MTTSTAKNAASPTPMQALLAFGDAAQSAAEHESRCMVALGRAFNDAVEAARKARS